MSALSDPNTSSTAQRRKKQVTYGRSARNPAFTPQSVGSFFDDGDKTQHVVQRRAKLPTITPALLRRAPSHQAAVRDEFDVPVSGDEFDVPVSDDDAVQSLPKPTPSRKSAGTPLRKRPESAARASTRATRENKRKSPEHAPAQKRTRTSSPVSPAAVMSVGSTTTEPALLSRPKDPFPPIQAAGSIDTGNTRRWRRNTTKNNLMLPSAAKGVSAPARLNEMIADVASPSNDFSGRAQDQSMIEVDDLPTTPAAPSSTRPGSTRRTTSTTPKQSHLWSQLLSSDPVEHNTEVPMPCTPREVAANPERATSAVLKRSASDMSHRELPRQTRLLDRLTAHAGGAASVTEDEHGSSDEDPVIQGVDHTSSGPRVVISDDVQFFQSHDSQSHHSESQASIAPPASVGRTTYARTRSYLEEDTLEANLMLTMPTASAPRPLAAARRSGAHPPARGKLASTFDISDESDDAANGAIRSIHELRAAGSKKRFIDDNAALFDDIKDHDIASRSRRRSALMELAGKLSEKTFLTRFVEHGFDRELSAEFTSPYPDPIYDFILCAVLARIAELDISDKSVIALNQAGVLNVATRCLAECRSINQVARDRRNNISKATQSAFLDFAESIRTSSLWPDLHPEALTIRLLGLKCMESMVLRLRRQGNKGSIVDRDAVAELVSLAVEIHSSDVDEAPIATPEPMAQRLALSILEFASTSDALSDTWSLELWSQFVSALPELLQSQDESRTLALKLCINLTNNNVTNCDVCTQGKAIDVLFNQIAAGFLYLHEDSAEQEHISRYDSLILSLGLMINLAEFSDAAREKTVGLRQNGLAALADVFVHGQERVEEAQSEEETQSNVAYGFLAVLLGNVCQNGMARTEVRACLPGKRLQPLVAAIDEFAQYNMKVDSQTFEGEEGRDVWEHFTGRLMAVVTRLQELDV